MSVEQTKEQVKLLKEVLENQELIKKFDQNRLNDLSQIVNLMKDDLTFAKERVARAEAELETVIATKDVKDAQIEQAQKLVETRKEILEYLKKENTAQLRRLITEKEITKEITEQRAANVQSFKDAKGKRDEQLRDDQKRQGVLEKTAKTSQSAALLSQGLSKSISGLVQNSARISDDLLDRFGPEVILAKYLGFDVSFKNIQRSISDLPKELDTAFTGMAAATALPIETLGNSLSAALDPTGAIEGVEGFADSLRKLNLTPADMPLVNVGIKTEEVKESLGALIDNAALFRTEFMKSEPAVTALTTNLIAGLKKVGVNTKTSAKIFDVFTKGFKKTPIEATRSLKSVANIADSLGISMGKAFGNFEAAMPTLSQFGDRMTEVFADLQARSAATGAEMGKLVSIAMKMDTFEGAAKAAQTLNGVLGDTLISVTDLVHADPDEKFDIIADAVNNSGIEFESLNRKYKSIIATAAGFDDVGEFQRQLYGGEAVAEAKDAADTSAMSAEKLAEKTKQTLTMQDKAKASVSSFAIAAKKAYQASTKAADAYSQAVLKAYKNNLLITENQEQAFMASKEMLLMNSKIEEGFTRAAGAIGGTLRYAGTAATAVYAAGSLIRGDKSDAAKEAMRDRTAAGNQPPAEGASPGGSVQFTGATVANLDPAAGTALVEFFGEVYDEKRNAEMAKATETIDE